MSKISGYPPKHFWVSSTFIPKVVLRVNFYLHRAQSRRRLNNRIRFSQNTLYNNLLLVLTLSSGSTFYAVKKIIVSNWCVPYGISFTDIFYFCNFRVKHFLVNVSSFEPIQLTQGPRFLDIGKISGF